MAVGLSFALATLSWRYVEEPFRRGSFPSRPLVWGSGAVTVGLVAVAVTLTMTSVWPQRLSPRAQQIAANIDYPLDSVFRSGTCFIHHRSQSFDEQECLLADDGRPRVLVLGDSHAAHLVPGLTADFPGSAISQVTAPGCRPVIEQPPGKYPCCRALTEWAFHTYLPANSPDLIIFPGRWEEDDLPRLVDTLEALKARGHEVLLVGPAAEWKQFVPRLLAIAHERESGSVLPDRMLDKERLSLDRRLAQFAVLSGTDYASIHAIQCDPNCLYFAPSGAPAVVDNSHLTREASGLFAGEFEHPALVR